jgi:hypothetical protein
MSASTAQNETRLPRAVLRISAATQARIDEQNAKRGTKPDPVDPNAPPAQTATPPADLTPGPQVQGDPREQDPTYWKQRFLSTEGRLKAAVAAHREETEAIHQQMSELTEQIRTLQAAAPAPKTELGELLTPEQVETLGEEQAQVVVETVMKAARKQVDTAIAAALKPLQDRETRQRATDVETRKREFVTQLTELVPDYPEVDVSPGWLVWLEQEDPATGHVRQELMNAHITRGNAPAVAKFFNAYKATLPKTPAPPVAAAGSGAGPSGDALPPSTRGLTKPSQAEIREFYKRCSTKRQGQPGYVTDQERVEFEKRLRL